MLRRCCVIAVLTLLVAGSSAFSESSPFPRPAGLEPAVRFWTRIYSEIDSDSGLIHDSVHLDVVYEHLRFPPGASRRARDRAVARAKERVRSILEALARGKRQGLSADEQRVLSLWPPGVTNTTLRRAARQVRFQLGQADKFRAGIERSGAWITDIHEILRARGVPPDLASLPHVESSFQPSAYSRVGAAGLWQFTRSTGRRFLRIDYAVDERLDPLKATDAAARLLLENHEITGTWPLAITAYNHGAAGMRRAKQHLGTSDIEVIVKRYKSRTFGFASRNFYAEFLAARDVDRDAERYFGALRLADRTSQGEALTLDHYYPVHSLSRALGLSPDLLRRLNPALLDPIWRGEKFLPRGYALRLPPDTDGSQASLRLAGIPASDRHSRQRGDDFYKVRRGDTLGRIARRHGVRETDLVAANGLRSRHRIRAGQTLRIPRRGQAAPIAVASQDPPADGRYRVRRGDSLDSIARRFGFDARELARLNGLRNPNRIQVGQNLRLPVPGAPGVQVAQAEQAAPAATATAAAETEAPPADATAGAAAAAETTESTAMSVAATLPPEAEAAGPGPAVTRAAAAAQDASPAREAAAPIPGEAAPAPDPAQSRIASAAPAPEPPAGGEDAAGQADAVAPPGTPDGAGPTPLRVAKAAEPEARPVDAPEAAAAASVVAPQPPLETTVVRADAGALPSSAPPPLDPSRPPEPDPGRYAVVDGAIRIEAGETIGHVAEWLDVRASTLRRRNGLRYGDPIAIGQRFELEFRYVDEAEFLRRRLAFHHALERDFFTTFRVARVEEYVLKRGDTLWNLARRDEGLSVWLLHRYNPKIDFTRLRPGDRIAIPLVEPRAG